MSTSLKLARTSDIYRAACFTPFGSLQGLRRFRRIFRRISIPCTVAFLLHLITAEMHLVFYESTICVSSRLVLHRAFHHRWFAPCFSSQMVCTLRCTTAGSHLAFHHGWFQDPPELLQNEIFADTATNQIRSAGSMIASIGARQTACRLRTGRYRFSMKRNANQKAKLDRAARATGARGLPKKKHGPV